MDPTIVGTFPKAINIEYGTKPQETIASENCLASGFVSEFQVIAGELTFIP